MNEDEVETGPGGASASEPPRKLGDYELRAELGRGGMGAVYRAYHPRLGREVAVKVLLAGPFANPRQQGRFVDEIKLMARLRHPNVVPIHDAGTAGGHLYFAMELVQGESLFQRIAREGPLEPRAAAAIVRTLAVALDHAHGQGIVHRDLKPQNVLLDAGGNPLLTDFGLAKDLEREGEGLTQTGQFLGTPHYAPPEQIRGEKKDMGPASDVYGLGATLFELLTGRPPFNARTRVELLNAVCDSPARAPGVDPDLDALVLHCLAKAPADRYPDMPALIADLDRYLADAPLSVRPIGALERLGKWSRRNIALLAAGTGVLAALAVGLPLLILFGSGEPAALPREGPVDSDTLGPSVKGLLHDANQKLAAGDWPGALAIMERAVQAVPNDPAVLTTRGLVRKESGDVGGAFADYSRAIAADPTFAAAWGHRGDAHADQNELDEARADLDRAIELEPRSAIYLCARGIVRSRSGDTAGATADIDRALELDPEHHRSLLARGNIAWGEGQIDAAEGFYARAIAVDPTRAMAWNNRGNCQFQRKDYPGAIADYGEALRLDPKLGMAWLNRGQARCSSGDREGGLEDLGRAIDLGFHLAYLMRGLNREDRAGAVDDLRRFLKTVPSGAHAEMAKERLRKLGVGEED